MATTVQNLVDLFETKYHDASPGQELALFNEVDIKIQRVFRQRQKTVNLQVVALAPTVDLPESVLWIRRGRYIPGTGTPWWFKATTEDTLEVTQDGLDPDTDDDDGSPVQVYQTHDLTGGELGIEPPPNETTKTVVSSTNASPTVLTISAAHGLSDGDPISVRDHLVNTAANGDWYGKTVVGQPTKIELYSDSTLLLPVAGNGVGGATGLIGCAGSPFIECVAVWHADLALTDNLPTTSFYKQLYFNGMCYLWAQRRHPDDVVLYKALFVDIMNEQDQLTAHRVGHVNRRVAPIHQRQSGYVVRNR